jgi:alpha-L-rhamnosidase
VVVHAPAGAAVLSVGTRRVAMEQPRAGAFATSSDTYNWLHEALVRTQENYVTGFPNDPSRERVGYTQDMENMFRGAAFDLASSERMYARWAQDMADGQAFSYARPGSGIPPGPGQMPTVIPGPKSDQANGVWWGGMMVWLPWRHFLHFGDARVLRRFYPNMAAYIAYLNASATPRGLVDWGLADWNSPLPECSGWGFANATMVVNTPGLYALARALGEVAAYLGRGGDAAALAALAGATASAHNGAFFNASSGAYSTGQQCHQAMALAMEGLVPAPRRAAAVAALRARVAADNTTLTVGFVSFLHLVLALADEDPPLLHALVTRRNYGAAAFSGECAARDGPGGRPSTWPGCAPGPYSNSVGAAPSSDLMKESWQGADAVMPSLSGPLLVHSWHTLAGLRVAEGLAGAGFANFSILPSPVPDLQWLRAAHDAPLGRVESNWVVAGGVGFFEAVLPPGAAASVGLPCDAAAPDGVFEGGAPLRAARVAWRGGRAFVDVGAGQWAWNCTLAPQFRGGGRGGVKHF